MEQELNKHMVLLTLFTLAFAPTLNAEDYFTRKGSYAIMGLFVCDDTAKITLIEIGWPGSIHDNQVWSNSDVYLSKEKYFSNKLWFLLSKGSECQLEQKTKLLQHKAGESVDSEQTLHWATQG